ncbi:PilZ domain-containing protein [Methylomonas sp. LL1]|uniref:PilZ domain-containing protein n=1 Tax=Methylomonas sp. LL1 TaxID=2785785 RepID=UPI0018C3CAE9|nr:PilZ domain-containing protein [Methylomonas sp. LL1]QPK63316.1 PilZ domain-containing protein [Methylomonas sp. LL1]
MEADKRSHKRFNPEGLAAHIIIDPPPPDEEIIIDGLVVDMSYSGIKIRLQHPLGHEVLEAELRISIVLPESGVPVSIHGMIKHVQEQHECGLQYADRHSEDELDSLMFECVKYAPCLNEE